MANSGEVLMSIPSKNPFRELSRTSAFTAGSQLVTPASTPDETLPGDSFEIDSSLLVELFPFNSIFFSDIKAHVDSFYVSVRSIYGDLWYKYFLLGQLKQPTIYWERTVPVSTAVPVSITNQYWKIADMLGFPVGLDSHAGYLSPVNPTKYFMYWRIIRDYYCDPVLDERLIAKFDGIFQTLQLDAIFGLNQFDVTNMPGIAASVQAALDNAADAAFQALWNIYDTGQDPNVPAIFHRRVHRDYFTSLLPDLQFGEPMRVPVEGPFIDKADGTRVNVGVPNSSSSSSTSGAIYGINADGSVTSKSEYDSSGSPVYLVSGTIRDLERLEAVQRFRERLNFAGGQGSNAKDLSEAIFGESPDTISIHRAMWLNSYSRDVLLREVVSTSPNQSTTTDPSDGLGTKTADGIVAARGEKFSVFTKEHGYIFNFFSLMPKLSYAYCPRDTFKHALEDYYLPDLAFIGEQEVLGRELISEKNSQTPDQTTGLYPQEDLVGYQPRFEEYRKKPSEVHGGFRTTEAQHMIFGRVFDDKVNLSPDFITYDNSLFNRIFSYVNPDADTCFVKLSLDIGAIRPVVENPTRV